ncbi:MAG: Rieske (2Fe-2S) domain protein [Marmoricola sp.]|jgi:Rieske Fe-S protein|nr:Rieske (2Fe-2S) domain protein [Marmoricola sp.]
MSENETTNQNLASRRAVIGGFVGLGVGVPLVAACGSGSEASSGGSGGTTGSGAIGKSSEVPVGGGKIFTSEKVVVTQPTEGDFKAFSAICTHQGCPVSKISGEDIDCTCHGSKFSIKDGSVVHGPATRGLEALKVSVAGGEITVT